MAQQVLAGDDAGRLAVVVHHQRVASPSAATAALTGSPEPMIGSGADMCFSTRSASVARPGEQRVDQHLLVDGADHLAAVTGGSARTTGIWHTPYSRRMWIASRTVSFGWVCTSAGVSPALLRSTSPTVSPDAGREPVVGHPLVVEDLGEVAAAAVGQQHDDDVVLWLAAARSAATTAIPQEPPTRRPSSRASRRVIANESASETAMISSAIARS